MAILGERIRAWLGGGGGDGADYEALEDLLLEADFGPRLADELVAEVRRTRPRSWDQLRGALRQELERRLAAVELAPAELDVVLALGVNGVGKTTSVAKLANYMMPTRGVVLAAADTFRAAAAEQLAVHAATLGVPVIRQQQGADAGAVVFDALSSAARRGADLVLVDTAGRMHNRADLVRELQKITAIVAKRIRRERVHHLLVTDATAGQNAVEQARIFHEAVGVDSLLLAKFDASGRGGAVLAVADQLGLPVSFLGEGEALGDLQPFTAARLLDRLLA